MASNKQECDGFSQRGFLRYIHGSSVYTIPALLRGYSLSGFFVIGGFVVLLLQATKLIICYRTERRSDSNFGKYRHEMKPGYPDTANPRSVMFSVAGDEDAKSV